MSVIDLIGVVSNLLDIGTILVEFFTSEANFNLGIVVAGFVTKQKKELP